MKLEVITIRYLGKPKYLAIKQITSNKIHGILNKLKTYVQWFGWLSIILCIKRLLV